MYSFYRIVTSSEFHLSSSPHSALSQNLEISHRPLTIEKPTINTAPSMHLLPIQPFRLTVRLLVPRARTGTAELLGLAPSVVGDEQCAVVLHEGLLELVLGVLVDEFLVVGDDGFGNGLTNGVDLGSVSTAGDADADVDIG
jgi:hypothetical protein